MDERYAELHALQREVQDRIAGIGRRLEAPARPTHPAEFQADVRALHDAVGRLKAKADAFTRGPDGPSTEVDADGMT
jgi:hypothetical protein